MEEYSRLSACALVKGMERGDFSSEEVVKAHLNRIEAVNRVINAVIQLREPQDLLAEARAADEVRKKRSLVGRLHGLPITIKNGCWVKGFVCDVGCPALVGPPSHRDATAVSRLKAEGAIVLGLTNVPELNMAYETDNDLYGVTRNPYDLDRVVGGSTGGEAAALASFMSPLGLGSDAGGSIRIPCHFTGVAGLKPTQFRIPLTGLLPDQAMGLVTSTVGFGPMARTVEDLILAYPILAGADGRDPYCPPVPVIDPDKVAMASLRVAFFTHNGIAQVAPEIERAVRAAAKELEGRVALVEEQIPPGVEHTMEWFIEALWFGGDRGHAYRNMVEVMGRTRPSRLLREMMSAASKSHFTQAELRQRLVEIDRFRMGLMKFMENYDVVLCPVAATPAKPHGTSALHIEEYSYATLFNLCQWPAVALPWSLTAQGLPIGIQVAAPPWCDERALAVARLLESIHPFQASESIIK